MIKLPPEPRVFGSCVSKIRFTGNGYFGLRSVCGAN